MFKNIYFYIVICLFVLPLTIVNALSESQKGAILENFKEKQYDLLFESDLGDFSDEYGDIFSISKKIDLYNNIGEQVESKREYVESKNNNLLEKIGSLKDSIKLLDDDIERALIKVDKINKNIINIKNEIEVNTKTITLLKKKVRENREILLEYLIYVYKKGNTVYSENQIDNLKSILLNEGNISEIINDLYFNGIIQVAGKQLIDNHRSFVAELYLKKVNLEKQESDFKKFRKLGIIEKKILSDKKSFKERILSISKGKQSQYQKYINDKIKVERKLQLEEFKEKVKFNTLRKNILKKYDCKFVDISKNTAETRVLSDRCLDINKMILSESQLSGIFTDKKNVFEWPVVPIKGISAYYNDPEYSSYFGSEHSALDIRVSQGSSIKAPADGYVIYIQPPTTEDYAYIALKHYDGYMTIYGHVSNILVSEFDFVKKGDVFAQSGGEFGTFGAGYMTTGPHVHFEVYKDKQYIDPLNVLDLSYIQYSKLPDIYKYKFYQDFRENKGYEYINKSKNSRVFRLEGSNEIERQKYMISKYTVGTFNNWQMWIDESLDGNIDPSFVMCIGLAETTLGKYMKTPYNIGNVGNTDSGATKTFSNARTGLYWMIQTLSNKYLGQYDQIRQLSRYGNKNMNKPIYASSPDNWHRNIIKCMSHLKGYLVPDNYNFRLE